MGNRDNVPQRQIEPGILLSYRVYASVVHWITIASSLGALFIPIIILANPQNNILNPNLIFSAIFNGASPADIWAISSTGEFPGAHYYLRFPEYADSWALFIINLGCGVGLFGLLPAAFIQATKEKDWFCVAFGTILAVLIFLSMTGIMLIEMG